MKYCFITGLFCLLIFTESSTYGHIGNEQSAAIQERPNILLVNVDDLGWTDLGFMGSNYYETPNIDQLAREGMIFSQAYAAASNCAPSRATLFTGKYSPRTGVYTVDSSERGEASQRRLIPTPNTPFISDDILTIAEVLQQNGYFTAHIGKWHISEDPTRHGFDVNIGGLQAGGPSWGDMGGYFAPYNNPNLEDGPEGEYLPDRLTNETIELLNSMGDQPFFLHFADYLVHTPVQPREDLEKKYEQKPATDRHFHAGYAAMVEAMDINIGRIIDVLKSNGLYENTFILFTSDNGGMFRLSRQWPLRSGKGSYFEGGIRVPMVVVWPGEIEPGSTSDKPVNFVDFFPTFLDVAGLEKPEDILLDGISLVPAFRGGNHSDRPLFWHFPFYLQAYTGEDEAHDDYFRTRPGSVVLKNPWKLHEYFEDGRLELYNLDIDIGEKKNLVDVFPQKADELHDILKKWREETNAPVPTELNPEYSGLEGEN